MVVLVSVSPNSIDRPALATMVGFVGVMFTIIAAPAIAFRPTSRLVEFLAKHGDHAGLWLLGPAIVVGLTVPNIKLQAVLATAMAIELTWFLRQRLAGRRRRQYLWLNSRFVCICDRIPNVRRLDYGHQGFPGVAFGGARADTRAAARGAVAVLSGRSEGEASKAAIELGVARLGVVRTARARGRFRAVWRGVCGSTSARAAAGPSTR